MELQEAKKFTLLEDDEIMKRYFLPIIIFITLVTSSTSSADNGISGKIIKSTVENTLALNRIEATPVVNEKKLYPNCASELNVSPTLGNWKTVTVECAGKSPWKIIIRNKFISTSNNSKMLNHARSNIDISKKHSPKEVKVAAIKRSISRGDVITPTDVTEISILEFKATDIFPNYMDLIGRRAKTTIRALTPVFSRQLETDFLVEEDMKVTIIYYGEHISVQMEGIALENGQYGDWIKVKNTKSGRVVLAKVVAEKKVNV